MLDKYAFVLDSSSSDEETVVAPVKPQPKIELKDWSVKQSTVSSFLQKLIESTSSDDDDDLFVTIITPAKLNSAPLEQKS
jgi:hypothetical protein